MKPNSISFTRPDDWHLHLRDGSALPHTVAQTARIFQRAIVMPNLKPPVNSVDQAMAYQQRIFAARPPGSDFSPLMTLYLTDNMTTAEIQKAAACPDIYAVKYYPAGATTNSENGVTSMDKVMPVLEKMCQLELPLLIHGEVTTEEVDIFDREAVFIEQQLMPLVARLPGLKIVLEHITTTAAVEFVSACESNVAATITPHHLLYNRNQLLAGAIRPNLYCLPILKRSRHQSALVQAATSGNNKFFLGTDSAPHRRQDKETACGCAGMYTSPAAIELYAEIFDSVDALDKLEGFASFYGADFYGLPRNSKQITLERKNWRMDKQLQFGDEAVVPIRAAETINWQLAESTS